MEQKKDVMSIIADPDSLTFVTRKVWQLLPECCLYEIMQHETDLVFYGTSSVFFLLRNMYPLEHLKDSGIAYRLVRISNDEDGKQIFSVMNLSMAEAIQLRRNKKTLWE